MKRRKPGKALEKVTRTIKDSDEFLEHIGSIAELYRKEHALDATPRGSAVRQSLKTFRMHATALTQWFEQSQKPNQSAPEHDALNKIGVSLYSAAHQGHVASGTIAQWLRQASEAADRCLDEAGKSPRKPQRNAPIVTGAALRATFEHHKLKFSMRASGENSSDVIRLLCAIARNAGDATLTPADAKQALQTSAARRAKPTT